MLSSVNRWANYLASVGREQIKHSSTTNGENIAWSSSDMSAKQATDNWYSEIKDYDFDKPGFSSETGT